MLLYVIISSSPQVFSKGFAEGLEVIKSFSIRFEGVERFRRKKEKVNRETSGPGQSCGYCAAMGSAQEMLRVEDTDNQKQICHENASPYKCAQIM